jgi:type 1 glutamine amidotransferase
MDLEPRRVLLVSRGWFHPHLFARWSLRRILARIPGVRLDLVASLDGLSRLDLSGYAALALYFHEKAIRSQDLEALRSYVAGGGGLMVVHSALASYKQETAYAELLGGRFAHHGPVTRFSVHPAPGPTRVKTSPEPFLTIDERYHHEIVAEVEMMYISRFARQDEPFAWRRTFERGRVFYLAAGHTLTGISHPGIRSILAHGFRWAVGEDE